MREVFESPCFNRVREAQHDFFKFIEDKVEAIEGDIVISFSFKFKSHSNVVRGEDHI
jgi:hypothetical protein